MAEDTPDVRELAGYRLGRVVGRGGFATVYEAEQLSLGRQVAVKILMANLASDADRRRFEREKDILARLGEHPSVVDVYDAGISGEQHPYIVMRLYRNGSLAGRLSAEGPRPVPEVVRIIGQLADALATAHAAGVLHRDIKPENVLLTDGGDPVLSDFGISAIVDPDPNKAAERTSTTFFTVSHAAPEVIEHQTFSVSSDIYALASTAYQLLAGHPAFDSRNPRAITQILDTPPPPVPRPDLAPAFQVVIQRGMAKNPVDRWSTPTDFAQALATALVDPDYRPDFFPTPLPASGYTAATALGYGPGAPPGPAPVPPQGYGAGPAPGPAPVPPQGYGAGPAPGPAPVPVPVPPQGYGAGPGPFATPPPAPGLPAVPGGTSGRRTNAIVIAAVSAVMLIIGLITAVPRLTGDSGDTTGSGPEVTYDRAGGSEPPTGHDSTPGGTADGGGAGTVGAGTPSTSGAGTDLPGTMDVYGLPELPVGRTMLVPGSTIVDGIALQPRTGLVAVPGEKGTAVLANVQTGKVERTLATGASNIYNVAFDASGNTLAAGGLGASVTALGSGTRKAFRDTHAQFITISPDGRSVVLATNRQLDTKQILEFWDATTGKKRGRLDLGSEVMDLVAAPDGRTVYVLTRLKIAILSMGGTAWSPTAGTRKFITLGSDLRKATARIAISADGKTLATSSEDENTVVQLWDAATGTASGKLAGAEIYAYQLAFSPDGKTMFVDAGSPALWDLTTGRPHHKLTMPRSSDGDILKPEQVTFSADGKSMIGSFSYQLRNTARTADNPSLYLRRVGLGVWTMP